MPIVKQGLDNSGRPILDIYVSGGTTATKEGLSLPGSLHVKALVDTGAGRSHVDLEVLKRLELVSVREERVRTASTGDESILLDIYVVDLALAGDRPGPLARDLPVLGSAYLSGLNVGMLIGRDLIERWLMTINGKDREFCLAYDAPSDEMP